MSNPLESNITLYTHEVSPWGDRAVAMLKEANVEFDYIKINPFKAPEWFKDISPLGKVPAMRVDGQCLAESWTLLEYINDRFLESRLMPNEPIKRAKVRFASKYFCETINPIMRDGAINFHTEGGQDTYKQKFNQILLEQAPTGPYFLGQQFSLADVSIAPFFIRLQSFNKLCFDGFEDSILKECPRLLEFYQGISSRPSTKETYMGDKSFIEFQDSVFHFFEKPLK